MSTGINPWPYPVPSLPEVAWARLPDGDAQACLVRSARSYYRSPDAAVVPAAGSQALIQTIPWLFSCAAVGIVGPTYAEHERCWRRAGHELRCLSRLEDVRGERVLVVTQPNNPDGRVWPIHQLLEWADEMHGRGGCLVVDAAFADVMPESDPSFAAGRPGLVVLRSVGKFFGLGGLRLGFALCEEGLAARIAQALGPWSVSGPALWVGQAALSDSQWAGETLIQLRRESAALREVMETAGLHIVGATPLFALAQAPGAGWFQALAKEWILVRPFAESPGLFRVGLPCGEAERRRFAQALNRIRKALNPAPPRIDLALGVSDS